MGLICRPILMYNEYVPAITGKRKWQYQVLGHHDGMDVRAPDYIETTESFQSVFDKHMQIDEAMDYATQAYFGLHNDDGQEIEFWEEETVFTFVSFIQFKEKDVHKYNGYLEKGICIETESRLRIRAYYTLDHNDSIIVVKSDRYDAGVRFINELHQNTNGLQPFELSNSYTVLAFKKYPMGRKYDEYKTDEIIGKIELRIIESYQGSINFLYNKLEEELKPTEGIVLDRYALLGTDDEAVVIKNIPCKDFLKLYMEDGGILCNSNSEVQKYAFAVTTKIMHSIDKHSCVNKRNPDIGSNKEFSEALRRYTEQCYKDRKLTSEYAEKKTLMKIINALGKIEYARNRNGTVVEYNFFTLFLPFYFFVVLHTNADDHSNEYYEFLTYFNICTQNYDKPDRVYMQTADFNTRYFEMQTKYFTLYSAYIYRLKQLLNDAGSNKYEFILCPGMSERTEVKEFHKKESDTYRLVKVAIAETRMYDIKSMFCILGHEVAHLVGTEIRSRENRYQHMLKMNSRVIVLEFYNFFKQKQFMDEVYNSDIWQEYESKFVGWIEQYIARDWDTSYWEERADFGENTKEIVEKYINESKKYRYYTENVKSAFEKAIKDMLQMQGEEIFEDVIWTFFKTGLENNDIKYKEKDKYIADCQQFLEKIIENFVGDNTDVTTAFSLRKVLDAEVYLLKECYADLISILSLGLSLEEYLKIVVKEIVNAGYSIEKIPETAIIARIAVVMSVMHYKDDKSETYYRWENEDIEADLEDSDVMLLQQEALDFMWIYICNDVDYDPAVIVRDSACIFYDRVILREVISYLLHCRAKFYEHTDIKRREMIGKFKGITQCDSADRFYAEVMELIVEYEKELYAELAETACEINKKI